MPKKELFITFLLALMLQEKKKFVHVQFCTLNEEQHSQMHLKLKALIFIPQITWALEN